MPRQSTAPDDRSDRPTVPIPDFEEWARRHAETGGSDDDTPLVRAEEPADEWANRHGHCPRP